jgi:hypothetical protein
MPPFSYILDRPFFGLYQKNPAAARRTETFSFGTTGKKDWRIEREGQSHRRPAIFSTRHCPPSFSAAAVGNHVTTLQGFLLPPPSNGEVFSPSRSRIGLEPLYKPPMRLVHCNDLLPPLYIYQTVGK